MNDPTDKILTKYLWAASALILASVIGFVTFVYEPNEIPKSSDTGTSINEPKPVTSPAGENKETNTGYEAPDYTGYEEELDTEDFDEETTENPEEYYEAASEGYEYNDVGCPKNQYVNGYYRSDGTYVNGYWRNSPHDNCY